MNRGMSSRRQKNTKAIGLLALAATAALGLGGCNYDGGLPFSADRFVYDSTPWHPYTISLVDTRTGETLWLVDIPVDHTLKCGFRSGSGPNSYKPDMMNWSVFSTDLASSATRNALPVPPSSARRLDVVLRPVPEFPDSTPGRTPFTNPSQIFSQSENSEGNSTTYEASNNAAEKTRPVPFVPINEPQSIPVKDDSQ